MEKIYNGDLKLISREYDVRTLFNNEIERFVIEERIDPITGYKTRINRSIKSKPRNYGRVYSKKSKCPFCNPEKETPDFEFSKKMYIGNSVIFSNKYPYGKYHAVLVPNYRKHVKNFSQLNYLDLYNSFVLIKEFYEKIPEKDYKYIFINLNKGFSAGASQEHLHIQILIENDPTNYFKIYLDKSNKYFDKYKKFFIEDYFNFEKQLNERITLDGIIKLWASFAPFRNNELIGYVDTFGIFFLSQNKFEEFIINLYNILATYEKLYENFNLVIFDTTLLKESRSYPIIRIAQRPLFDIGYMEILHLEYVVSSIPEETAKEFKENLEKV